ncbi:universal stress protein [Actinomadura madurae]|uniref:universal stress protein n=1 Tax=Actinomadura madurae TaxID=1993 RepID=UPI00202710EF|nr:universal stress protein [Actinomadura madurae]MCP9948046.1 universal stress protein [Actinomadura madurae]MCP9964817.1 universal stress protein [Actinomadura madurae]MCP9977302.1 universal stress protein [Actinomadura madurae]MCQ0011192.1 universal stress protein [Actinomadura madurae]MCQ0013486.1 universal stress protein [Actinomadura madurae]
MERLERNQGTHVLFGYDGTAENDAALRWAVEEARLRGLELILCHCWHWPYPEGHTDPHGEAVMKRAGQNLLEQGVQRAKELGAPGTVHTLLMRGPVPRALLQASGRADVVVIGAHERLDEGATALELSARADRPVIVVRDGTGPRRVVAGADGSAWCDAALGFAMGEAAMRDWDVHVVYGCWEPAAVDDYELSLFTDRELLEKTRAAELEEAVGPWRERYPKLDIEVSLLLERPAEALRSAARDAGLLVLGDRAAATGGLGSTSSRMLRDARCAVAIVPSCPR